MRNWMLSISACAGLMVTCARPASAVCRAPVGSSGGVIGILMYADPTNPEASHIIGPELEEALGALGHPVYRVTDRGTFERAAATGHFECGSAGPQKTRIIIAELGDLPIKTPAGATFIPLVPRTQAFDQGIRKEYPVVIVHEAERSVQVAAIEGVAHALGKKMRAPSEPDEPTVIATRRSDTALVASRAQQEILHASELGAEPTTPEEAHAARSALLGTVAASDQAVVPSEPIISPQEASGLPKPAWQARPEICFERGADELSRGADKALRPAAAWLSAHPEVRAVVEARTDTRGTEAINGPLSKKRADHIKRYFLKRGIESGRIKAIGLGQNHPIELPGDSPRNRCAIIRFE